MRIPQHGTDSEYNNHKCRCDDCKAAHAQKHRELRNRSEEAKVRHRARSKLQYAVLRGDVKPQMCEICGFDEVQGHHEDYSKPLDVNWLCVKHHKDGNSPHVYKVGQVRVIPRKKWF